MVCPALSTALITLDTVRAALALENFDVDAARRKMAPTYRPLRRDPLMEGQPRLAATLLLLFPKDGLLHFVLTRRRDDLAHHAGQISFPGGRKEEGEGYAQAALRETCEELGVCQPIELIGKLTELYIPPSDFLVQPFVGYLDHHPEWRYDPREVAEVIECPVTLLLDDSLKRREMGEFQGVSFEYGSYHFGGHRVWGATAIMLAEFESRLRQCL